MNPETKEKLLGQAKAAKAKAMAAGAWCKEKTVAVWKSGRKGKAVCIAGEAVLLLLAFLLGRVTKGSPRPEAAGSPSGPQAEAAKAEPRPDAFEFLAGQVASAQAEMQKQQAEIQAKIAADNAAREAEAEKRRAEEEARRKKAAAEQEAYWKEYREQMLALGEEMQRQSAEAQAENAARLAERDRRLAEAEARRKAIAAENAARVQAHKDKVAAKQKAMEDARNHVPADIGTLEASALSDKDFSQVFIGDAPDDEETVYAHGRSETIRVLQSTSGGLLVGYAQGTSQVAAQVEDLMGNLGVSFDRVVWIDTRTRLNEENRPLRDGFYIRKGMHSHIGTDGGEHVLAQYVEVNDEKTVAMLKAELKRRADEKRIAEEEAAELAAERGAYELDIPIKSICGFKLGVPPSQVKGLLLHEDGTPVRVMSHRTDMFGNLSKYRLAKPFRLFTHAEVAFADNGVGKHLESVTFRGEPDLRKYTRQSYYAEVETTARLIEKKFSIQFKRSRDSELVSYSWQDRSGGEMISIDASPRYLQLYFTDLSQIRRLDGIAREAAKTSIRFDADEGADQL